MLQQTQALRVIAEVASVPRALPDAAGVRRRRRSATCCAMWQGLGYPRRAATCTPLHG